MIIHMHDVVCCCCGAAGSKDYEPCYKSLLEDYKDIYRHWRNDRKEFDRIVTEQNLNVRAISCHIEALRREIQKCSVCGGSGTLLAAKSKGAGVGE